jgi:hypothetical protein
MSSARNAAVIYTRIPACAYKTPDNIVFTAQNASNAGFSTAIRRSSAESPGLRKPEMTIFA